jgi:zona occludens toxin (predicted ATPase)
MATSIHHGPPGSFKSFTLVQRFAIPALQEGRTVVSNIRGFDSLELIKAAFPDIAIPAGTRLIYVDCSTAEGRKKIAQFFHWVPIGSAIFIDELQEIYPARRDFKMTSLDVYVPDAGEVIEKSSTGEDRPRDIFVAFDKQRHYNWDIYGSTTNIAKVKKEIRQCAEWAYRHRSMVGVLPWKKNSWREHQHDPEYSGKSKSHVAGTPVEYKADPRVFRCYSSTATGNHVESNAGRSILSDPKLRAVALLVCICLSYMGYQLFKFVFAPSQASVSDTARVSVPSVNAPVDDVNSHAVERVPDKIASPALDASLKPTDKPIPKPSETWRIASYILRKRDNMLFIHIVDDKGHLKRVNPHSCIRDEYNQWTCTIDNEIVTANTGSDKLSKSSDKLASVSASSARSAALQTSPVLQVQPSQPLSAPTQQVAQLPTVTNGKLHY